MKDLYWHGMKHNIDGCDKFALLHLLVGVALTLLVLLLVNTATSFIVVLLIAVIFEVVEHSVKDKVQRWFKPTKEESTANQICDVVFVMFGWFIGVFIFMLML